MTTPRRRPSPGPWLLVLLLLALGGPRTARAQDGDPDRGDPFRFTFSELAPGVWTGVREDMGRLPVVGNATFVIGEQGVVVFDGGAVPLMSERLIERIRALTPLPVTHVVISHWHGDHSFGIVRLLEAFPGAQVVAHEFTHAAMTRGKVDYIHDGVAGVVSLGEQFRAELDDDRDAEGRPLADWSRRRRQQFLEDSALIEAEYARRAVTLPTLTFRDRLTIHSGARRVELLFLGVGNTAGDVVLWLPEERVVATGDLVVHPTPYGFNVPPAAWAETLERLNALEYELLVPGHGAIQRDRTYVDLLIEVCGSLVAQREALLGEGLTVEQAQARLDLSAFEARFTGGDPDLAETFEGWFAAPMRTATFKELTGEPMVPLD